MDEEQFDSLVPWDAFTTKDAARADARLRRCATLGFALYGGTPDHLARQLLAPSPDIPAGFSLDDLRELERSLQNLSILAAQHALFARSPFLFRSIFVGTRRYTMLEARCEIVRRAIEYLERQ